MQQAFTSIPFETEKYHGLAKVNGFAKFSSAGIVLEFESKLLGLVSVGVEEGRIAIGDILDVKFKKGVFKRGAKIEIRTKSLAAMAGLPNDGGKLILKLKAEDFESGRDAVENLHGDKEKRIADRRKQDAADRECAKTCQQQRPPAPLLRLASDGG